MEYIHIKKEYAVNYGGLYSSDVTVIYSVLCAFVEGHLCIHMYALLCVM